MTGCCLVAWTSAKAMRWVKETLSGRPAAWSAPLSRRRRSSSTPTGTTRKVVAVGTVRLSLHVGDELGGGALDRRWRRRRRRQAGRRASGPPARRAPAASACGPLPAGRLAADGPCRPAPFGSGLSPTTPLSNRRRHSGPTAAGSRRNSSYMACAKPALAVSNTLRIHEVHRLATDVRTKKGGLRRTRGEPAKTAWS